MNKKIYCFCQDLKTKRWIPATKEALDQADIIYPQYPVYQPAYKKYIPSDKYINKDAETLWDMFRQILDVNKVTNIITNININGQKVRVAFGSGLSREELNKNYVLVE